MSYINNALRKLQKEKNSSYIGYGHIVSAPGKNKVPAQKWLSIVGILIVFLYALGMIFFIYGLEEKKASAISKDIALPVATIVGDAGTKKPLMIEPKSRKIPVKTITAKAIAEAKVIYEQALQKQRNGKMEEAKSLYKKVIKMNTGNIEALNNLGVIYISEKQYKMAIDCFNNALNIKSNYVDAHYNLACLYAKKNDVSQSLFYLKNAIEFNPEVKQWAKNDGDLKALANLQEFKNLVEKR